MDGGSCRALAGRGAAKKGLCTAADGSVLCANCSPCRKQLAPACRPVNKAVCHSHVLKQQCPFQGPGSVLLPCVLGMGAGASGRAADLSSWCHPVLCKWGLARAYACCSAEATPRSRSHVVAELRKRVLKSWPQKGFGPWSLSCL